MNSRVWFLAAISIGEEDWIIIIATIFVIWIIAVGAFAIISALQHYEAILEQERRKTLPYEEQIALINRREDRGVVSYACKRTLRAVKSFKRSVKIQSRLSSLSSFFSRRISHRKSDSVTLLFGSKAVSEAKPTPT